MFKKILSFTISIILASLGCVTVFAETHTVTENNYDEVIIMMDNEVIKESEPKKFIYTVDSLDNIPILSCRFNNEKYNCFITQPERDNGYTGKVTLTCISDNSITEYTVNVYDNNTFKSHFINLGGDPWVTYHNGWYYYMYTGNGFYVSKSRELERVNSNPVSVFKMADLVDGVNFSIVKELWAPELHFIDGYWYIYFTAYDGEEASKETSSGVTGTAKNHRMYVLKSDTDDAQGSYTFMGQLNELQSDYANDSTFDSTIYKPGHWAIDQSVFKWNDKLYAVWSGWPSYTSVGQRIYIAEMKNPYTISSARVEICRPEFAYETYSMIPPVNEGPQALISPDGSTLNIAFSVNRFDDSHYSLGLLTLKKGGNPLNADDWTKTTKPVFETSLENSTYSVGHCSFVPSPDKSESFMVYHARRGENTVANPREIRVQQFYWNDDGTPYFGEAISADTPVQIPSGTAKIERTKLEAENATLSGNAYIPEKGGSITTYDADYYSGGKRVALTQADSAVTFNFTAPKDGKYTFSFLSSASTSSGFAVSIDDNISFTRKLYGNSNNINNFCYYDTTGIELSKGEHIITVAYTSTYSKGGYLDRLDIWNEADADTVYAEQDNNNLNCTKTQVVINKAQAEYPTLNYENEYIFDSFGDFDKYWGSSEPFRQEYGNDAITTCRPGTNKRLLVSNKAFYNVADFKASVEITPSKAHTSSENGVEVVDETVTSGNAISSGIIFRIGKMYDYSSNIISFSGYRCFLIANNKNELKIQAHKYYFADDTAVKASNKALSTSSALTYTPGDTYILEVEVIGNALNATVYNTKSPETTVTLSNVNLKPDSSLEYEDAGRIGLYSMPAKGRVTFNNLKITPHYSPASVTCDFGNLNQLSSYTEYEPNTTNVFSDDKGVITIPNGVSKLIINDEKAQNVSDFEAKAKIKITNSSGSIQTGIAFRVNDVTTASPGITGYVLALQKTTSHPADKMVINFTKYGTNSSGAANKNLGNQSYSDTNLLSDITDKTKACGLEFYLELKVTGNKMTATVTRVDKPALSSTYNWVIDDKDYGMNKKYPVYYESGRIGTFSNGVAKISEIQIDNIKPTEYAVEIPHSQNGNIASNITKTAIGSKIELTLLANSGYYVDKNKLQCVLENGNLVSIDTIKENWDNSAVFSFIMPDGTVAVQHGFSPILSGDTNGDYKTDVKDLVRIKKHTAQTTKDITLSNADINSDKFIDATDILKLRELLLNKS
ncbi:MAG: hypothetical protein E7562_07950 [Ruminococcaceae bacterium]|nr:hypothetical protein [Oscillospiraceae bacterium]